MFSASAGEDAIVTERQLSEEKKEKKQQQRLFRELKAFVSCRSRLSNGLGDSEHCKHPARAQLRDELLQTNQAAPNRHARGSHT